MHTNILLVLWTLFCLHIAVSYGQNRINNLHLMAGLDPEILAALSSPEALYPNRPDVFKTPGELRKYIEDLNSFYAITGRPRFGKRNTKKQKSYMDEYRQDTEPLYFN